MSGTRNTGSLLKAIVLMLAGGLLAKWALDPQPETLPVSARSTLSEKGDYGGDLEFLRRHHVGPQAPGESNHYIDLWSPGALPALARVHGLTNNNALILDSHGRAGFLWHGAGYGFYPHSSLVPKDQATPHFSARDIAAVLGPDNAAHIHNIVLAGCNEDGRLRSREFRRHFVNATNITYLPAGKLAFKPMFYQAITVPSWQIRPLYGVPRKSAGGRIESRLSVTPVHGSEEVAAFVADLYLPDARKPFATVRAGRELLAPEPRLTTAHRGAGSTASE